MFGLELSPEWARVRALRSVMFQARMPLSGEIAGLIVGARRHRAAPWTPAAGVVTVEAMLVHGVAMQPRCFSILVATYGWSFRVRARIGETLVVYLRNDTLESCELRAVIVLAGSRRRR